MPITFSGHTFVSLLAKTHNTNLFLINKLHHYSRVWTELNQLTYLFIHLLPGNTPRRKHIIFKGHMLVADKQSTNSIRLPRYSKLNSLGYTVMMIYTCMLISPFTSAQKMNESVTYQYKIKHSTHHSCVGRLGWSCVVFEARCYQCPLFFVTREMTCFFCFMFFFSKWSLILYWSAANYFQAKLVNSKYFLNKKCAGSTMVLKSRK